MRQQHQVRRLLHQFFSSSYQFCFNLLRTFHGSAGRNRTVYCRRSGHRKLQLRRKMVGQRRHHFFNRTLYRARIVRNRIHHCNQRSEPIRIFSNKAGCGGKPNLLQHLDGFSVLHSRDGCCKRDLPVYC